MIGKNKIGYLCLFFIIFSFAVYANENPADMFADIYQQYRTTEYKWVKISDRGEGAGLFVYDINKQFSDDIFCYINFLSTSGQTQYLIWKIQNENIWRFHKRAYFYERPMELENAEIHDTYFIYKNGLPYAYNDITGEYDIQADTDNFIAITDVRSLASLIEMVENALKNL